MSSIIKASNSKINSIYWFRKCLRLHDNPALLYALENSEKVYPIFILDPWFVKNAKVGPNRWRFLLQSLNDLNENLLKRNSRLILIQGPVLESLTQKINEWKINLICFESDTEPYAKMRDGQVMTLAEKMSVKVVTKCSHTLYDPADLFKKNGYKTIGSYQGFIGLAGRLGEPAKPLPEPIKKLADLNLDENLYKIPDLASIGVKESDCGLDLFPGGESEALKRFHEKFENESYICSFEKPQTSPNSLAPSTTVLSPYIKFGCISVRLFYERLMEVYRKHKGRHSKPPESLQGQLLFREYFYFMGAYTENFDKIKGNTVCRQIEWDNNAEYLEAWKDARTGFPWIDAIMTQLRQEGWIHHLARHAVACFLTRGDLYQSWEKGQEVFEEYLLDADWSLNAANWQWLSASAFFHQYWKCYSPIEFGKKTDKNGVFIKKYLPVFKNFPSQYIYEPWMAPPSIQKSANCVIGIDYPKPIVDHKVEGKICMNRMKEAYAAIKEKKEGIKKEPANTMKKELLSPDNVKPKTSSAVPKTSKLSTQKTPSIKDTFVKIEKKDIKKEPGNTKKNEPLSPANVKPKISAAVPKTSKLSTQKTPGIKDTFVKMEKKDIKKSVVKKNSLNLSSELTEERNEPKGKKAKIDNFFTKKSIGPSKINLEKENVRPACPEVKREPIEKEQIPNEILIKKFDELDIQSELINEEETLPIEYKPYKLRNNLQKLNYKC